MKFEIEEGVLVKAIPEAEDSVVHIPDTVSKIESDAFKDCRETIRQVIIPGSVKEISSWAFEKCTGITQVIIPGSVKVISGMTFGDCTGLTQVTLEEGVEEIKKDAFYRCKNLSSIHIPGSVHKLSFEAFAECMQVETLDIPENVRKKCHWSVKSPLPLRFAVILGTLVERQRSLPQLMRAPFSNVRSYLKGLTDLEYFLQQYLDNCVPMYKRIELGYKKELFCRSYKPEIDYFHEISAISSDVWEKMNKEKINEDEFVARLQEIVIRYASTEIKRERHFLW